MAALVAAIVVWWWVNLRLAPADSVSGLPALASSCAAPALPDFSEVPAGDARKQAFFDYLLPWVRCENDHLLRLSDAVVELQKVELLGRKQRVWMKALCKHYLPVGQCQGELDWDELNRRVDAVPASLVLAQAANESAWGTSRFAREGNNLFGQWCFTPGCGLVPIRQRDGFHYEVQSYKSVSESLRSYLHNLNTHRRYGRFRNLRAQVREEQAPLSGARLAEGLKGYSERGEEYIRELQQMIRFNSLQRFERAPGDRELFSETY